MSSFTYNTEHSLIIPGKNFNLAGFLYLPQSAKGLVLFAHGSGSSRLSRRNQFVARCLQKAGLATLLFDLLTAEEEKLDNRSREYRFNIPLLASRMLIATAWLGHQPVTEYLALAYFGASTGSAAALLAAAEQPERIKALVSRGGRPDLAGEALSKVEAPSLFIVGEEDKIVIELNQEALKKIKAIKQLTLVPQATHLFEEPGTLETVAHLAEKWFLKYLA